MKNNGIHLKRKHFKALVRFVDADLNGDVDLTEFQGLLKGDHVFLMDGIGAGHQQQQQLQQKTTAPADESAAPEVAVTGGSSQ